MRVVNQAHDIKVVSFAGKSCLHGVIGLNYNVFLGVDQLKLQLKDIIKKYPFNLTGNAVVGYEKTN